MKRATLDVVAPAYPVVGTSNALHLMLLLQERQYLKLTDVSSELGIAPSTAHRLLSMFRTYGFVEQDDRGRMYRVGPNLLRISQTLASREAALATLRPHLEALVAEVDETVHVAILHGPAVVYLDCIESRKSERATPRIGRPMPSHATSAGKALLSALPRPDIERLFPSESLAQLTPSTIAARGELLADVARTKERGFAINEAESQLGFFSCGRAIGGTPAGQLLAITIAAPSVRFRKNRQRLVDQLCITAEAIEGSG